MRKFGNILIVVALLGAIGVVVGDRWYVSKMKPEFEELEKQRIVTSNKLATAKIVFENLYHVRDLVFKNMDFPGVQDSLSPETRFFDFITTCINDLKIKLVSTKPVRPQTEGRITTFGYDIEMEGDFFKFGELCAKFENSRRITSVATFDVALLGDTKRQTVGAGPGNKGIAVKMRVNTVRVAKEPEPIQPVAVAK
jgi:hypothetical protein